MKRVFLSVLLCFFVIFLPAQPEKEISSVLDQQLLSWNAGDIDGFMAHYWKSDSLRFMTKNGVTQGWQQTLDRYKKGYPNRESMGQLDFSVYTIELLSNEAAIVTGKWKVTSTKSQEGHFNLLFKKIDNRWVIVLDHTS